MSKIDKLAWVESYRPQLIEDCILPKNLKSIFSKIVADGEVLNMSLCGSAGLGKTTVAKAICNELELDCMIINCSEDSGIDVLRNKIRRFASTFSLTGGTKVVILDEADYLNANSTQPALRGFIEEFATNCKFILTCNYKNRLIEPLLSRCPPIEFNTSKKILAELAAQFMKRMRFILDEEGITYNDKTLAELIMRFAPDWRRVLNECHKDSKSGELTNDVLVSLGDESLSQLIKYLKEKDFKLMRTWVSNNADVDSSVIFRKIYDNLYDHANPQSIPQAIITLAEYQFKAGFVADREINLVACLTELMAQCQWN